MLQQTCLLNRAFRIALFFLFLSGWTPIQAQLPQGALNGTFQVGANSYVYFSQGNLQYIGSASTPYWKFADHQWDCLRDNGQGSDSPTANRDLFGWGTSGYNHGANCYQPWSTSQTTGDYYAYGSSTLNLFDESGQADWGYNAISNGGNQENSGWRTLTEEEWEYLFTDRNTSSGIRFVIATVNMVHGVILLPDDWDASSYPFVNPNDEWSDYSNNIFNADEFASLEQQGAVFLPVAGIREGTTYFDINSFYYWTSSSSGGGMVVSALHQGSSYTAGRYEGLSVRLVRNTQSISFFNINLMPNPAEGGTVSGGGSFVEGESCTVTAMANSGYTFINWTEDGTVVSTTASYTFTVTGERNLVANFVASSTPIHTPEGAINGLFSVGEGEQIFFSQGNLQYIGSASTPYWKFADHQWEYLGATTNQNSTADDVDRDLFGWGTSGYNHGANCYQPWSTSQTAGDYYAYGSSTLNLFDESGQADWGYNAISNGGNRPNSGWRTLTKEEWTYLFLTRATTSGIRFAKACVNGVNGVILLPDDWSADYYPLTHTNAAGAGFGGNTLTVSQWTTLEEHGAVFLPAAGFRYGSTYNSGGSYGFYWSGSYNNVNNAWQMNFDATALAADGRSFRCFGRAVRLVHAVTSSVSQTLHLENGWKWVSGYVEYDENTLSELENAINASSVSVATLKSQTGVRMYENGQWYSNTLTALENENMYMVQLDAALDVTVSGALVNPEEHPITLSKGWNWIGFMSPTPMSLENALSNLTPNEGDVIKGQNGFATYSGTAWAGSLKNLEPGRGYMYQNTGDATLTLIYPAAAIGK